MEKTIKKPVEQKPTVGKADRRINAILSVVLGVLCVAWIYPIVMIFFNSLKTERAITTSRAFELPTAGTFVGLKNYIYGIQEMDFLSSFWYSLVITVSSVVLILLCCSMCAWFITRVNGKLSKLMYGLCMFSMVVPFQMVMFTLAKTADSLKLNNPYNICIIYLIWKSIFFPDINKKLLTYLIIIHIFHPHITICIRSSSIQTVINHLG